MTMEFRPTGTPDWYDLYEGDQRIGEFKHYILREEGEETEVWDIRLWSLMGTNKTWHENEAESHEEAIEQARELYKEFVAERRELNKPGPGPKTRIISTPMGGQRRK